MIQNLPYFRLLAYSKVKTRKQKKKKKNCLMIYHFLCII